MGGKWGAGMRKYLWLAAALMALVLLVASGFGICGVTRELRDFAERIHVPPATGPENRPFATALPVPSSGVRAGMDGGGPSDPSPSGLPDPSENGEEPGLSTPVEWERVADLDSGQPFVMLLIGVDRRPGDRGRADALLAAAVNPSARSTLIVSIPRDTRTTLVGLPQPRTDKINHAYAYGGAESTVATAEQFLGVPVSRYIQADMDGFRQMVDLLGGVRVDNGTAFEYEGYSFKEGPLHMSGEEALAYVRMRKDDPRGDLGRGDRQKAVLRGLAQAALRPDRIRKWPELLEALSEHMKTDMAFEDWKALLLNYRKAAEKVETEQIAGSGRMMDGIYYFVVSEQERERISRKLAEHQLAHR